MLNRIKTFRALFSKEEPTVNSLSGAEPPAGYYSPHCPDLLMGRTLRKRCLQQIWANNSLSAEVYQRLYLFPLRNLLSHVQNVPAARQGHWSLAHGFGDLTLQFTSYAVRLAKGYMFPPGAAPEEQAVQNVMWNAVIYWSALFWHLPLLLSLEGELVSGLGWQPGIAVPDVPYRFRFREKTPEGEDALAFASLVSGQLMPGEAFNWLAGNQSALQNLSGALWNRHPIMPVMRNLLNQAAEKVGSPLNMDNSITVESLRTEDLRMQLQERTNPLENFKLQPSAERSGMATSADTSFIIPSIQGFTFGTGIEDTSEATDFLQSGGTTEEKMFFSVDEHNSQESFSETDELLSLFTLSTSQENVKEIEKTMMGITPAVRHGVGGVERDKVENMSIQKGKAMTAQQDYNNLHNTVVNNGDKKTASIPVDITVADIVEGELFWTWFRDGVSSGKISFNNKEDKIHIISGHIFLPIPGVFFDYLKAIGKPGEYRGNLQASFERLNLHKRRDHRRFYFARLYDTPDKAGKFKRVKGYLLKSKDIFRKTVPQDSQFLSFS